MGLDELVLYKGQRKIQKGATKIYATTKELKRKGYITILKEIPTLVKKSLGDGISEIVKGTTSGILYEITSAGRRQAKDTMMLDDEATTNLQKLVF